MVVPGRPAMRSSALDGARKQIQGGALVVLAHPRHQVLGARAGSRGNQLMGAAGRESAAPPRRGPARAGWLSDPVQEQQERRSDASDGDDEAPGDTLVPVG